MKFLFSAAVIVTVFATSAFAESKCQSGLFRGRSYSCEMNHEGRTFPVCVDSGFHLTAKANGIYIFEDSREREYVLMFIGGRHQDRISISDSMLTGYHHKRPDFWDGRRVRSSVQINLKTGSGVFEGNGWSPRGKLIASWRSKIKNCRRVQ